MVACLLLAACGPGATRVTTRAEGRPVLAAPADPTPEEAEQVSAIVPTTTEAPTTTLAPERPTAASRSRIVALQPNWEALRQCEAHGDYSTNTGNGYYGAYQFSLSTWQALGYEGLPSDAPPSTQDEAARRLYTDRGASPWPVCGARL